MKEFEGNITSDVSVIVLGRVPENVKCIPSGIRLVVQWLLERPKLGVSTRELRRTGRYFH